MVVEAVEDDFTACNAAVALGNRNCFPRGVVVVTWNAATGREVVLLSARVNTGRLHSRALLGNKDRIRLCFMLAPLISIEACRGAIHPIYSGSYYPLMGMLIGSEMKTCMWVS